LKVIDNAERPVATCLLDPEKAYLAGKLVIDDLDSLRRFRAVFPVDLKATYEVAMEVKEDLAKEVAANDLSNDEITDVAFLKLMPKLFSKEEAQGWTATLNFDITDAAGYTIHVKNDEVQVEKGLSDDATATAKMDLETLTGVLNFGAMAQAGNLQRVEIDDSEFLDEELGDDQLEAVAGGKGSTACGGEACGNDAGAGSACAGAACVNAAGAGTACSGDACNNAAGVGTACVGAACVNDAAVGTACAGALCGTAAGAAGGCAGDVCGLAVGVGVCAGNVCGVDVLGGADVGPCGVNVIPGIPGI
jgi:uncharacterized LabA/DUF88 family protein